MLNSHDASSGLTGRSGLRWRTQDVASCLPPSARLPLLAARAAHPAARSGDHKALARTLLELGRLEDAWHALAPALAASADSGTHLLAGIISRQCGRIDQAAGHLRAVLADEPASVPAIIGLARCLEQRPSPEDALSALEDGLCRVPGNRELWAALTDVAVRRRDVAFLTRALADLPPPDRYIACIDDARIFLARQAGDATTLERMLQAPALVAEIDLVDADDPLLAAVLAEVAQVSDFVANPYDKSTTGGRQAAFAVTRDRPAWSSLCERIHDHVELYLHTLASTDPPFPFPLPAQEVALRSWTVRLGSGGRQRAHLHPTGWLTGVVYLAVPPEIMDSGDGAGCLEIPLLPGGAIPGWPVRRIRPGKGKLVLFPPYMRHATVPFHSEQERVCIAFDLLAA